MSEVHCLYVRVYNWLVNFRYGEIVVIIFLIFWLLFYLVFFPVCVGCVKALIMRH